MNKKNIKPLVLSSLAALSMGSLSVAGTFALFTDKAETSIQIGAGTVNVRNAMTVQEAYSLNDADVNLIESGNKIAHYVNGGLVNIADNVSGDTTSINVSKWTPGDGAKFRTAPTNESDITIKVRLKVVMTGELAPALEVRVREAGETGTPVLAAKGQRTLVSNWVPINPGVQPTAFDLDIYFPNHGFEITASEEGIDNQYQDKTATILISYEAVQGNADVSSGLLERINSKLATEEIIDNGKNLNMYDAVADLSGVATLAQIQDHNYVWGREEDQFYERAAVASGEEYKYFHVYDEMPTSPTYSVYASNSWSGASVSLEGIGFDAGDANGITSISYVGFDALTARENIIRSNSSSTNIVVNAPLDTVRHYGTAGSVDIQAAANHSYYENGKVAFIEIAKGRVALETGSAVSKLHFTAAKDVENPSEVGEKTFDEIKVAYAENVVLPTFSRDAVKIADEGTLVVELQKLDEEKEVESNEFVWLTKQGVFEQIAISDNADSVVSEVAEETVYADEVSNQKTKTAAQQIANNIADQVEINDVIYDVTVDTETREIVLTNADVPTETPEVTAEMINEVVKESGLSEKAKEEAKEEVVTHAVQSECPTKHANKYRAHNDYWKRENDEFVFYSDYKCDDCNTIVSVKHELGGMWSNTENHLVPFVVDNLNGENLMGKEIYDTYKEILKDVDFGYGIGMDDLEYYAIFDSGRAVGLSNYDDWYTVHYNGEMIDLQDNSFNFLDIDYSKLELKPAEQYADCAVPFASLQDALGSIYADFFIKFDFDFPSKLIRLCGSILNGTDVAVSMGIDPRDFGVDNFTSGVKQTFMRQAHFEVQYSYLNTMQFLCGLYIDSAAALQEFSISELIEILENKHVTLGLCMYSYVFEDEYDYEGEYTELFDTFEMTLPLSKLVPEGTLDELKAMLNA